MSEIDLNAVCFLLDEPRQVGARPSPEITEILEDFQPVGLGEESVVWQDHDGVVLDGILGQPLGEPVLVQGVAGDEEAAVDFDDDGGWGGRGG